MFRAHAVLCALLVLVPAVAAGAAGRPLESRITRVTVYATAAQVTRAAAAELEAGVHTLVFEKLPLRTHENALGCRIEGEARVLGLRLDTRTYGEPVEERLRGLERALAEVSRQVEDREADLRVLDQKQEFLIGVREGTPETMAAAATVAAGSLAASLRGTLGFIEEEWMELETARLRAGREKTALVFRKATLESELGSLRRAGAGAETRLEAEVEVEVLRAGKIGLELSYLVDGAAWRPYYDARLDRRAGKVAWSSYAEIRQTSGEDWQEVDLSVATADPRRTTSLPELDPIYLGGRAAPPRPKTATALARTAPLGVETFAEQEVGVEAAAGLIQRERADTHMVVSDALRQMPAGEALNVKGGRGEMITGGFEAEFATAQSGVINLAELTATATGSVYRIERRESIPCDDSWHRATIAVHDLPVALEVVTAPRKAKLAYLRGRATNETGAPLLPGPVHLFTGGDFMGTAALARPVAPGGPMTLSFGSLDRVEVEHELVSEVRSQNRRVTQLRYHYRIKVRNFDGAAQRIEVLDQVPVATDTRIEVELRLVTPRPTGPAGDEPDPRGALRWDLDLAPGAEQAIDLEYEVRFPREWQLAGL